MALCSYLCSSESARYVAERLEQRVNKAADGKLATGCLHWQAAGTTCGAALLDELHRRLGSDAAAAPLLRELLAAAFAPYAAHLRAWLFGCAPAPTAFGAPPSALAAQFFPDGTHAGEQVPRCLENKTICMWCCHVHVRYIALLQAPFSASCHRRMFSWNVDCSIRDCIASKRFFWILLRVLVLQLVPGDLPAFLEPVRRQLLLAGLQMRVLRRLPPAMAAAALADGWAACVAAEAAHAAALASEQAATLGAFCLRMRKACGGGFRAL